MSSSVFNVNEHVLPCQYIREYPGATLHDQEEELRLHIKHYTPKHQSSDLTGAVTIIGAHANGFPKELYEPLWEELSSCLQKQGRAVRGIWIADVAHQGQSGILNEGKLGNDPSWMDHPRDLLHMINHFRKEMPRPLIGIGHSLGGNNLVNLSLMHPRLLSTLILIEPVVHHQSSHTGPDHNFTQASTFRRDIWPSRADAIASFRKNRFYQSWDPRVLDRWISSGLRDLPTQIYPDPSAVFDQQSLKPSDNTQNGSHQLPVTLTTSKHQEVFTFLRPNFQGLDHDGQLVLDRNRTPDLDLSSRPAYPFYRPEMPQTFVNLPYLRPSVLYIFGGKSPLSPAEWRTMKTERTGIGTGGSGGAAEGRVKEVVLEKIGHFPPMEAVSDTVNASAEWIASEMDMWQRKENEWKSQWEEMSTGQRTMISEEWKQMVGGDPKANHGFH